MSEPKRAHKGPRKEGPRKGTSKRSALAILTGGAPVGLSDEEIELLFARDQCGGRGAMPERRWQLQDAKNQLSELVRRARGGEAQVITVRGQPTAVLVPIEDFRIHHLPSRKTLAEVLLAAPRVLSDAEADQLFARDQSPAREIDLG